MKTARTLSQKIAAEAARICRDYINILERGQEPATLRSIVQANRADILECINDGRANMSDTIEKVRSQAHFNIKCELELRPELAQRLIDFRAARKARDEQEAMNEQRNWRPLPAIA